MRVPDHAPVHYVPEQDGAWVTVQVWVNASELEPDPGPSYDIWLSEWVSDNGGCWTDWSLLDSFTCDDGEDGRKARMHAHDSAQDWRLKLNLQGRYLSYVAVREASLGPPKRCPGR